MVLFLSIAVGREEGSWLRKVLVARVRYIGLDGVGFRLEYDRRVAIEAFFSRGFLSELKEFPPPRAYIASEYLFTP